MPRIVLRLALAALVIAGIGLVGYLDYEAARALEAHLADRAAALDAAGEHRQ